MALHRKVFQVCGCVAEYVPNVREIVGNLNARACNFYEFATCVSYIYTDFEPAKAGCLPACIESDYEISQIQV